MDGRILIILVIVYYLRGGGATQRGLQLQAGGV